MKIAIEPGHGAKPYDTGAIGLLIEDEVVADIGNKLIALLKLRGHEVLNCRPAQCSSEQDSLESRVEQCNLSNCDLYISLHLNAFKSTPDPMGSEIFAISDQAKALAQRVQTGLVKVGFKDRKVKLGSHLYVLANTDCPAILIEFFFLDSIADVELYKKLGAAALAEIVANAIAPGSEKSPEKVGSFATPLIAVPTPGKIQTIGDLIEAADGSTAPLLKLNQALIKEASNLGAGLKLLLPNDKFKAADDACCLALNPAIISSFQAVAHLFFANYKRPLIINSCYRTAAQQIVLHSWCEGGLCGIEAAATPGTSGHEGGNAIDTPDYTEAKQYFKSQGWQWQYDKSGNDPFHFQKGSASKVSILALQKYYNRYNPKSPIAEDGDYGPGTKKVALTIPIDGY
jgi:N-acetylmuramoyl-L-alanine amidase